MQPYLTADSTEMPEPGAISSRATVNDKRIINAPLAEADARLIDEVLQRRLGSTEIVGALYGDDTR